MNPLFVRAIVAFLALPGVVAFAVPWLIVGTNHPVDRSGLVPFLLGVVLLLWCVASFYVARKGTLAPWAPPTRLVTTGLYRLSRNPMYVAVSVILWGWALTFRSVGLAVYALGVMVAFHLRVVFGEEPWLARTHGEAWARYASGVPRWFGLAGRLSRMRSVHVRRRGEK
jgi:protein-S-isoprenylcysteine O-methyltransferase Ste14